MNSAFNKFRDYVFQNMLVLRGDRILLAVSAGKDSIAMLYMMQKLKDEVDFETGVFHLNHLTRGAESDADADFVESISRGMGLFFRSFSVDVAAERPGGLSFEEHARNTRYSLLAMTVSENGFTKSATAHNSDDNSETVLMRALSGTGIRGLRGIPARRDGIIRPMLGCTAAEIYGYLTQNGYNWREDRSNLEGHYLRNFVRNRLFPVINERFPDAQSRINHLSSVSAEHIDLLDDSLKAAYPGYLTVKDDSVIISHPGLKGNIPAIKYILSRELNEKFSAKISASVLDEIIRNYLQPRANNILYDKGDFFIRKKHGPSGEMLIISAASKKVSEGPDWEYVINTGSDKMMRVPEAGIWLNVEESDYNSFCAAEGDGCSVFLSVGPSVRSFTLRNRRKGDRIALEFGSRKIKDLMIEKKLDSEVKNKVPIIIIEGKVAACLLSVLPGSFSRISCNFLVCNDSERIIRINIKTDSDI